MNRDFHATLLLLRRGPVAPKWEPRALGQEDVPLARDAAPLETRAVACLASFRPERVLSSDLARAQGTAGRIARKVGAPHVARRDLREQRFGQWQGRPWAEVIATDEDRAVPFLADFTRGIPPQGESLEKVRDRVVKAVFAEGRRNPRKTLCYVGHAGPIRGLIAASLDWDLEAVQRVRLDPFGLSIIHLQGPTATLTLLNHPATGEPVAHMPCS